ncbi:MAG: N-acetylmuramoyl-L-alanine amidase [Bacteroidales bacterium]|jgi:N-acetylmuramoyl-L-alanine amidase|nr:N-acetylmuramoyl-L-alanine amidase [Bacteroidales bacterium]
MLFKQLILLAIIGCFLPVVAQERGDVLRTVVIDPGHGGKDPGTIGRLLKVREKDIVLDVSLQFGKMIEQAYPDIKVIYTRKTDVLIDLYKRGDIANKAQANLFISIHANWNEKTTPMGAETYVMGNSRSKDNLELAKRENSVILIEDNYTERYEGFDPNSTESYIYFSLLQNAYLNQSLSFAAEVQEQFKAVGRVDRGVKDANFLVLWKTTMPSVLVELGFASHAEEEKFLASKEGRKQLAVSLFDAFCIYKKKIDERDALNTATVQEKKPEELDRPSAGETSVVPAEEKTEPVKVEFCVQIATSGKPVEPTPQNFKKHKNVERIQSGANLYKYVVGRTSNYSDTQYTLTMMRADFKDAFVVGIINGKIVPARDALKALK